MGGTGQTTVTIGDVLYGSAANVWSKLAIGTTNYVLSVAGGLPAWSSLSSLMADVPQLISAKNGNIAAITKGQVVYFNGTNDTVDLAKADVIGTARALGVVYDASIAAGATGNIIIRGLITGILTLATNGTEYFLSAATAGLLTSTAPAVTGQVVTRIGLAKNATDFIVRASETIIIL